MSHGEYPPPHHVLRDLDFEVETVAVDHHVARYRPGGGGVPELGGLLTVVDLLAGTVCLGMIEDDWMATSTLTFHLVEPVPAGELLLSARSARVGRTTIAIEVEASAGDSPQRRVGEGIVTFSRLVRRESNLSLSGARMEPGARFSFPADPGADIGTGGSLRRAIGCDVVDPRGGVTETPLGEYVRNSFGALNGGVVATIVEAAALAVAGSEAAGPGHVTDVVVHYLAQGRIGPVTSVGSVLRRGWSGSTAPSTVRVEVSDSGEPSGDRLMAVAHVVVERPEDREGS